MKRITERDTFVFIAIKSIKKVMRMIRSNHGLDAIVAIVGSIKIVKRATDTKLNQVVIFAPVAEAVSKVTMDPTRFLRVSRLLHLVLLPTNIMNQYS